MELDDTKKYLMTVAMFCLNYAEYLKIEEKKQTDTLGILLRIHQDKFKTHTPQEMAILITFLTNIKEEYFSLYIELFNKEILSKILKISKNIEEQINNMNYIEDKYYEFDTLELEELL